MRLPEAVVQEVRDACGSDVDAERVIQELDALLGEDEYRGHIVWAGPAWTDTDLLIDVYVLTDYCLYNYWVKSDETTQATCSFLDVVRHPDEDFIVINDCIGLFPTEGQGGKLIVNPDGNGCAVRVEQNTWGRIKALYQ